MSAAAQATATAPPPPKSKKKLIVILAAVLLLALAGGGGAIYIAKKKAAAAAAQEGEEDGYAHEEQNDDGGHDEPPVYVALDPFVVNLTDREADHYAQIGVTLEVEDTDFAEEMKAYMPAIRSAILLILAHKSSQELLEPSGKETLASEIMRAAVRPMGIKIEEPSEKGKRKYDAEFADSADEGEESDDYTRGKKRRKKPVRNPVQQVHFSNFIIQ